MPSDKTLPLKQNVSIYLRAVLHHHAPLCNANTYYFIVSQLASTFDGCPKFHVIRFANFSSIIFLFFSIVTCQCYGSQNLGLAQQSWTFVTLSWSLCKYHYALVNTNNAIFLSLISNTNMFCFLRKYCQYWQKKKALKRDDHPDPSAELFTLSISLKTLYKNVHWLSLPSCSEQTFQQWIVGSPPVLQQCSRHGNWLHEYHLYSSALALRRAVNDKGPAQYRRGATKAVTYSTATL